MTLWAIFSDIHGYSEAFLAALADAREQGAEKFACLGDLCGYGPDGIPTLEIAMGKHPDIFPGFDVAVRGNHEGYLANIKLLNPAMSLGSGGVSGEGADYSHNREALELIGERRCPQPFENITLPGESFQDLARPDYEGRVVESLVNDPEFQAHLRERLKSPTVSRVRMRTEIPYEALRQVGHDCITAAADRQEFRRSFIQALLRLDRRDRALGVKAFIDKLPQAHEMEGALFVHDNPINPGNEDYFVSAETAKKHRYDGSPWRDIRELEGKPEFGTEPGKINTVFVGHHHEPPETFTLENGVRVRYVGAIGDPRYGAIRACYTLWEDATGEAYDRSVKYDWQATREKMRKGGYADKFASLLKKQAALRGGSKK